MGNDYSSQLIFVYAWNIMYYYAGKHIMHTTRVVYFLSLNEQKRCMMYSLLKKHKVDASKHAFLCPLKTVGYFKSSFS